MFRIGGRVRIIYSGSAYNGLIGTIEENNNGGYGCRVVLDNPPTISSTSVWCGYRYLEALEVVPLPLPG
jgi:hypothetical protein